ncbi:MAG: hypothetical protein ACOX7D_03690 [Alphaproteobacteria bacterium]|jgi:hypothetical protein
MIVFKVFNTNYAFRGFKPFGLEKQFVTTSFNRFNKRELTRFTIVAALGKIREYNRVASALDFNWGV